MRLLAAVFVLALAAPAAAKLPPCYSGKTLYHQGGVIVFDHHHPEHDGGFDPTFYHQIYACAGGHEWLVYEASPYTYFSFYGIRRVGRRLGFLTHTVGYDNGDYTEVGWTDVRGHRTRIGAINVGEDGDPYVPNDRVTFAIAVDGAVAVLGGKADEFQQVALLEPRGARYFTAARVLTETDGGLVQGSLRIDRLEVSWAQTDGTRITVDRASGN